MTASNHAALGEGLKLYTDAMRRFVKEQLISAYPNSWWESGVVNALGDQQRNNVKRDMEKAPDKAKEDFLDAAHIQTVIGKNQAAFKQHFGNYRKWQSLLGQVATARNEHAHSRSGDMPADEVGHALFAMEQVLGAAKLPEATKIEALRKDVLQIEPAAKEDVREVKPAKAGELPYWWQVCEPQDGFKNPAAIDESLFAATLGLVYAGAAREEYLNPKKFFEQTYFTESLKTTIRDVASRLNGGEGPAVTELQTPFGGGKTHALLTLYHLINSPKESLSVPGVAEAIGDVRLPADAKVLVFDGQEYGVDPWVKEDSTTISTLWGELMYQANPRLFREYIVDSDARGDAPGSANVRKVLQESGPCLILIDELVSYLIKLNFSNNKKATNLYRQTVQFVQELFQLVGNMPAVCAIISLPQSVKEFGGIKPEQLQQQLGVLEDIQPRADRVVSKRTPVNDEEIYTLISKRLFKKVDDDAAERVAKMYQATYERTRGMYEPTIFSADYALQQVEAYPLHPELIDVLYKKWSTASDFPRTRTVLQLLASVVADQWVNRREAYTIQSAHVNLERERVRTKIISAAGGGGWDGVVATDIIGGDAHADDLDTRRGGDYERYHVARGLATTLLMHSFGGRTRVGALTHELRLGTVAPNVGPEYVTEILETLEQSLWYVHREGELVRFLTKANVYRMISQRAEQLSPVQVREELQNAVAQASGSVDGFQVISWAAEDGAIADSPNLRIAVLEPSFAVQQDVDKDAVPDKITRLWERSGSGFRQWRNALIIVAPDADLWTRAEDAMREVMAYRAVLDSVGKGGVEVTTGEKKDLEDRAKDKKESLRTSIATAYRCVFFPDDEGLGIVSLPVPATRDEYVAKRVVDRLSDITYGKQKILDNMGAVYFDARVAPRLWKDEGEALDLSQALIRFQEWTYLPMLPQRGPTLRTCIKDGLREGLWAVAIGDNKAAKYQRLIESPEELDNYGELFDGSASLVRGDMRVLIREQLGIAKPGPGPGPIPGPEPGPGPKPGPGGRTPAPIPKPAHRLTHVKLTLSDMSIGKTANLQPYLFRVIQEHDAGARVVLHIEIDSDAGIPEDEIERRILEGLEQLGIDASWEK